ncbi:PREDICTED: intestinal mucin-like protein [Nanorana parkeri]|uniref:intestinal mucin-like protein n=1 Tax=Nanorana parkeri TaxID=125878 RepID=UPI0008549F8B|nr:PREDICTED: intestinal mucin-like protein [Nanorana parkeri]
MKNSAEITCEPIVCNTDCQMGYSFKEIDGQCCGKCVQEFCVLNNTVPIKPGNLWYPPGDNCTSYGCEPDTFIVVKSVMSCPQQKPINCDKGILVNFTSTDGCCTIQFCEPRKCDVMTSWKLIESGGCRANVTLTNCGGYCSSISRHPNFPKMKAHDCTCCQATKTTKKKIQLDCNNGRKISYTFTDILQCSCRSAACVFTE